MGCIVNQRRTHARSARDGPAENDRFRLVPEGCQERRAANGGRYLGLAGIFGRLFLRKIR